MSTDPSRKGARLGRRIGVIDIGSNSVRFVVYSLFGSAFFPVYNEKVLAGLGRGLRETGCLSPSGKDETLTALKRFRQLVNARDLSPVLIAATAAMRDADDAPAFRETVLRETGFDISPVPGTEEARLAALGVFAGDRRAVGLACDLGGASLELVPLVGGVPEKGVSLKLGPFQVVGDDLRSDFDPDAQRPVVREALAAVPDTPMPDQVLHLIGGAWRNLFKIHQERTDFPLRVLQGYEVAAAEAMEFCRWAYGGGMGEVLGWSGISSRRRETLPYSALVLEELIARFDPVAIRISSTGLREGLMVDRLADLRRVRSPLIDGCRDLARGNLQAEGFAKPLDKFLAPVVGQFPSALDEVSEARIRQAANHLAGMGRGFHPDYRAELVFETVLYAPLSGLSHEERAYLAQIMHASYTGGLETANEDAMDSLLRPEQRYAGRVYGNAIRLAVAACGRAVDLLEAFTLTPSGQGVEMKVEPHYDALMSGRVLHRLNLLNALLETDK